MERIEAGLGSLALQSKKEVKKPGCYFGLWLSFKSHINQVTKTVSITWETLPGFFLFYLLMMLRN